MPNCKYCGKPAGLFKQYHKECETNHAHGIEAMESIAFKTATGKEAIEALEPKLVELSISSLIPQRERDVAVHNAIIKGWEQAVDYFLEDGVLDADEETRLTEYMNQLNLSHDELSQGVHLTKMVKATVLREVMEGKVPEGRVRISGDTGLNYQKSEKVIWLFPETNYYQERIFRRYEGGSAGGSIRIAKGMYFRTSSFRGHPVDTAQKVHVGEGNFVVTNKNIYFSGGGNALRIPYKKILTITPYEDGIGIQKDGAKDKPQFFITNDGWFTYNLVTNVSRILAD